MERSGRPRWRDPLLFVRTVLPLAVIIAGVVILVVRRDNTGLDAFAMLVGAGLSIWLLNFLYRLSVTGERDREEEDRARAYLDRHGHWPDEGPTPDTGPPPDDPHVHEPSRGRPPAPPRPRAGPGPPRRPGGPPRPRPGGSERHR